MKVATIAVVIAHYNGSEFIERALESVAQQTLKPDEVIVIDDGSDTENHSFLLALQSRYKFQLINQENAGQAAARNAGVAISTSKFFCILDQDDYFLPNHIEALMAIMSQDNPRQAFAYGDLWRQTTNGLVVTHTCVNRESQHPHKSIDVMIRTNQYILPSASLIRKSSFEDIGGFDPQFRGYEDDDLFLRFFAAGYSNRFTPEAVTVWTINEASTSYSESMARSRFLYFKKLLANFGAGQVPEHLVFGMLLVPKFAFQFASDVVAAALSGSEHFQERQDRLKYFVDIFRTSTEVADNSKRKFMIASWPLLHLNSRQLRFVLKTSLRLSWVLKQTGLPGITDFLSRYGVRH